MSNEISNERLEKLASGAAWTCIQDDEGCAMAKELLALRKVFSVPDCWEIAGQIFTTEEEALSYGFTSKPEPLYSKPEK